MKIGDRVKVTSCHEGWTDKFVGMYGIVDGEAVGTPMWMVAIDGDTEPRGFFADELTVIEGA